jgi:indole-3-pyruvate monooxygenase
MEKVQVCIVGAGPSGLATAACLSKLSIPYVIVEREDCIASLWRKHTYNCLKLHLAKEFCELPHMPYPNDSPTYVPKDQFLRYMDDYVEKFHISPKFNTLVESCMYDEKSNCWNIMARDIVNGTILDYASKFVVVATGENSAGIIPNIDGLQSFQGEAIHSSSYKSVNDYVGKSVLVVGCGNSGFEIARDLAVYGANTSIVIRSPVCAQFHRFYVYFSDIFQYRTYSYPVYCAVSCYDKGADPLGDDSSTVAHFIETSRFYSRALCTYIIW